MRNAIFFYCNRSQTATKVAYSHKKQANATQDSIAISATAVSENISHCITVYNLLYFVFGNHNSTVGLGLLEMFLY